MDTGEGRFEMLRTLEEERALQEKFSNHGGTFTIGEIVELKGSKFRVKSINPKGIRLKLLKRHG